MKQLKFDKDIDLLSIDDGLPNYNLKGMLDERGCYCLENRFEFLKVSKVVMSASIKKTSKYSWELKGNLKAQITQSCVVTGKPVKETLDVRLEERYVLQNEGVSHIAEINVCAPNVEVLVTSKLSIGEVIAQIIGVEAEAFPKIEKTPEIHFFGGKDIPDNPFAKLAVLKSEATE